MAMFPTLVVVAKPLTENDDDADSAVVLALAKVVRPVTPRVDERVEAPVTDSVPRAEILPAVAMFPFEVVVALPLTNKLFETESWVVEALAKMFNAPENVCEARLRSATLDDRAVSLTEADGKVTPPADTVKPFEAVRSPPKVPVL